MHQNNYYSSKTVVLCCIIYNISSELKRRVGVRHLILLQLAEIIRLGL